MTGNYVEYTLYPKPARDVEEKSGKLVLSPGYNVKYVFGVLVRSSLLTAAQSPVKNVGIYMSANIG